MPPEAPLKPATVHSNTEFSPGLLTTPNTSELYIAQFQMWWLCQNLKQLELTPKQSGEVKRSPKQCEMAATHKLQRNSHSSEWTAKHIKYLWKSHDTKESSFWSDKDATKACWAGVCSKTSWNIRYTKGCWISPLQGIQEYLQQRLHLRW